MHQILFKCTENYKQISENHTTLLRFNELTRSRPGCSPREVIVLCSYQGEDMLVGPSCEDPCLVTEVEPPAQQTAPFRVPVKVVVDDAGETQRHVAKKRCVLHHMRISCREMTRGKNLMSLQPRKWGWEQQEERIRAAGRKDQRCTGQGRRVRREYRSTGEKRDLERQGEVWKWARPSLILSSIGNGSSGRMLAATRICLESSNTLRTGGEKDVRKLLGSTQNSDSQRSAGWEKKRRRVVSIIFTRHEDTCHGGAFEKSCVGPHCSLMVSWKGGKITGQAEFQDNPFSLWRHGFSKGKNAGDGCMCKCGLPKPIEPHRCSQTNKLFPNSFRASLFSRDTLNNNKNFPFADIDFAFFKSK